MVEFISKVRSGRIRIPPRFKIPNSAVVQVHLEMTDEEMRNVDE